jgi:hypothetical protein
MKRLFILMFTGLCLCASPILTITGGNADGSYNGSLNSGPATQMWCIDFFRPMLDPATWPIVITHYADSSAPLWAKFDDWLIRNRLTLPHSPLEATYAIWIVGSAGLSPHEQGAWPLVLSMAFMPGWASYQPDLWLYDGGCDTQRFITTDGGVPEPGGMALLGGGLIALAWLSRRR